MKRRTPRLVALAVLVIWFAGTWAGSGSSPASSTTSLPELLEKAIFTEETVGDLDAAIAIYRQIVEQGEADRVYVAQAQFRLGMCYVKQDKTDDAVETLRQLVLDFPQQDELVERARARLDELGHGLPEPGVVIRQIWDGAGDFVGPPSPDGRYTTFTDWSTGNLMLHDFTTGQDQNLTDKVWATSSSFPERSAISPDGKRVAYAWFNADGFYDLRVIGLDGSAPRVLYANEDVPSLQLWAWSPDGKNILANFTYSDRPAEMVLVSTENGAVRALKEIAGSDGRPGFSPDGRYIVYSQAQDEKSRNRDIFLFPVDGDKERRLVGHPADDLVLGWAPNGSHLLFASDRTGEWGAWAVGIADGTAVGVPQLVKPNLGDVRFPGGDLVPMGFTREGSFYYGIYNDMNDVYIATIDPETGQITVPPTKATQRFEGSNRGPDWSRDGEKVAFVSQRKDSWVIVIRTLETGEERELRLSSEIAYVASGVRWSTDGRSFLITANVGESDWRAVVIDATSGDIVSDLVRSDPYRRLIFRHVQWSPKGKAVLFERRSPEGSAIVSMDLETRQEQVVYPGRVGSMTVSPDGRWVAFTTDVFALENENETPTLWVVPATGGEPRAVFRAKQSEPFGAGRTPLAWTPDGRHLIVGLSKLDPGKRKGVELWRVAVEGGEPRKLDLTLPHLGHLRVRPDGKRIAFWASTSRSGVWAMENFLPKLKGEAVSEVRR